MNYPQPPHGLAEDLRRLTAMELSLPSRMRYVALLLAASIMTATMTALLLTEESLPLRTSISFGVLAVIGLSWMGFAAWVLTRKRMLLAGHRVLASRLAVGCTAVFALGALLIGFTTGRAAGFAAAALGAVMLGAAVWMLIRAKRAFGRLSVRRQDLERQLRR
jgi:hypothetical protein